jgi:hypothetical protein
VGCGVESLREEGACAKSVEADEEGLHPPFCTGSGVEGFSTHQQLLAELEGGLDLGQERGARGPGHQRRRVQRPQGGGRPAGCGAACDEEERVGGGGECGLGGEGGRGI